MCGIAAMRQCSAAALGIRSRSEKAMLLLRRHCGWRLLACSAHCDFLSACCLPVKSWVDFSRFHFFFPMALIVHKYGGTSMGSTERIKNVARRVAKWHDAGHQIVVVPSAMSGETNRLIGLAKEIMPSPIRANSTCWPRPASRQLGALLAMALQAIGKDAVSYAGWQVPIKTDSAFTKARIQSIDDARVRKRSRRRQAS
jgi:hypothetical protein